MSVFSDADLNVELVHSEFNLGRKSHARLLTQVKYHHIILSNHLLPHLPNFTLS